jgi:amino acid permease
MELGEPLVKASAAAAEGMPKNSVAKTAVLIIANCAGAGILSLPKAVNQAGVVAGSLLILFAAVTSAHTADILGRCYDLVVAARERDEEPRSFGEGEAAAAAAAGSFFARSPYAAIGMAAAGRAGALAVTVAQVATQFCVMVLFFLISGVNLNKLAPAAGSTLFFSLVTTLALTPFMLLRPGHVWGTAVFAIAASIILVGVVLVLCATGAPHDAKTPDPPVDFASFGTAFGVILFGFGGHAILPALQATLDNPTPQRFRRAIMGSFAVCTAMYLSTSVSAVIVLGGTVSDDILTNFSGSVNDFGLVAVTAHLLFAAVTVHIPLGQIMDHYAGAGDFSARQVALRVATMCCVAVAIWAIGDHFFCVIGLVGGTCNNAMIFIFPPYFYARLCAPEQRTPLLLAKMGAIGLVGTLAMVSALIGAVDGC